MHRRVVLSLLGVMFIAVLAVAGAQSRSTATVNIGWSGDKSGPTVASQGPALDGLRSYIRMVNDAGGVKGNKINLIEKDDAYNVAKALGNVKSFINDDGVALVTGIGNSSGFASILPVLNAEKVPGARQPGHAEDQHLPLPALHVPGQLQLRRPGRGRARVHADPGEAEEPQGRQGRHRRHRGRLRPGVDPGPQGQGREGRRHRRHPDAPLGRRQRRRRRAGVPVPGREDDPRAPLGLGRHRDAPLDREVRHRRADRSARSASHRT